MCGVVGLVRTGGSPLGEAELALVRRMNAAQRHRGPDDEGVTLAGDAVLGSTRLAILDLGPAGHMPMASEDGRAWIAYNGEVYNHAALRAELEAEGHRFRSRTDTEVVLAALRAWGAGCLSRLRGMFAFALWDEGRRELLLARDRLGIKPLYWAQVAGRLLFASEIKALSAALERPTLDVHALLEWSLYQTVDGPARNTLLVEVRSLLPGELLRVRDGRVELETWYAPHERVVESELARLAGLAPGAVAEEVEERLARAVSERLMSDVPVGTLLSGGLDSSLITALAAGVRQVTGYHVSVAGYADLDESRYAREVARHLGIELATAELTATGFRRDLARAIHLSDLPLTHANSVAYLQICERARQDGTLVLLSGEGADELFGGYRWRYRRQALLRAAARWLDRLPRRLRGGLEQACLARMGLPAHARRFDQLLPQTVQLLDRWARFEHVRRCEEAYGFVQDPIERSTLALLCSDLSDFLPPLLRRLDRMSMGASVECRVPFLAHELVELALHLPLAYRVGRRADKWVLQEVARRRLPRALVERKKMGFPLPLADYLAPLARPEFFEGGFWREVVGVPAAGPAEAARACAAAPFAFLAQVSAEIWGRAVFLGETEDELRARIEEQEHEHARHR